MIRRRLLELPLHLLELAGKLVLAWLRWFWGLSVVGKFTVTALEIVVLYLVAIRLPLAPITQRSLIDLGSIGLVFLCVFAVLFGSVRAR